MSDAAAAGRPSVVDVSDEVKLSVANFATKADIIADIEGKILRRELHAGGKLPSERDMCRTYAVSRPVVREALSGLAERGHIEIFPGRGSYVRAIASDGLADTLNRTATRIGVTARHLVEARTMLECSAAEMAARNADDGAIRELFAILGRHEETSSLTASAYTDLEFHETIARASGNPVVALMFGAIRPQVYALMLRSHSDRRVHQLGDPLHRRIAEAIESHAPDAARAAMTEHLTIALQHFGGDLDKSLADVLEKRGLTGAAALQTSAPDQDWNAS